MLPFTGEEGHGQLSVLKGGGTENKHDNNNIMFVIIILSTSNVLHTCIPFSHLGEVSDHSPLL